MRILVTGGSGFVGSHLTDALLARGDEVLVVDNLTTGRQENLAGAIDDGAELLVEDVTDERAMARVLEEARPEVIFHLAAQPHVQRSVTDPVFDLRSNVEGTVKLLELARRFEPRRIVFASTGGAIYGEGEGRELPLDEDADCLPYCQYGQSKMAAELYLSLYGRLHGISSIALRLANVYGPRQDPKGEAGVVAIYSLVLHNGDQPIVFGNGRQTRDLIYVGDVVRAFVTAAGSDAEGAYNIGTGKETSVLELGERLAPLCGASFEPRTEPARPGEIQRISIASERAADVLGWRAEVDLDEGLRRTAESFAPEAAAP
ncbi:MAG TPA: NAD-dependent epimerase/dehydratase family protein [Solirubrobacterales bacterium]|nr:NAD-dependent epimerase/dehydratase family protein [Solirubrobacterales bacterium]